MYKDLRNAWEQLPTIPKTMEDRILAETKLTGSFAYGGFIAETSDVDRLWLLNNPMKMQGIFERKGWAVSPNGDYADGIFCTMYIKMKWTQCPVNLLMIKDPMVFQYYVLTTRILTTLKAFRIMQTLLKQKEFRVNLFQLLWRGFAGLEDEIINKISKF